MRYLIGFLILASMESRAQAPLWGGLKPGHSAVGFRTLDTVDVTRTFPDNKGRSGSRPMRLYVWYPGMPGTGAQMTVADLIPESWANGNVFVPTQVREFERGLVRTRSGPSFARMTDAEADSILAMSLASRRRARPIAGRFPVVLLAPGAPINLLVSAEYLASRGFIVVGAARRDERSLESREFTPNLTSIEAEARDLAFLLGATRTMRNAEPTRVGLLGYSSSGLSNLAFAFISRVPRAIAVFEGWEGLAVGPPIVAAMPHYEPQGFRSAYLLIEKSAQEELPSLGKSSVFFDSMVFAPRWRIAFDDAAHPDFESPGVALGGAAVLRRNFIRAHEVLADYFTAELGAGEVQRLWPGVASSSWMHVTSFAPRDSIPTRDEFYHLAERDPDAADRVAEVLSARGVTPFTEASLLRLATIVKSRRPADAATLYGIVTRAFPSSVNANVGRSDALAAAGRMEDAREAARRALQMLDADQTLSEGQKRVLRDRLMTRLRD